MRNGVQIEGTTRDILHRLRSDAGQLTIATLIQEREVAAAEIERLRRTVELHSISKPRPEVREPVRGPRTPQDLTPVLRPGMLMRLKEVCRMLGVGSSTVYTWVAQGKFPRPMKIGQRASRWRAEEIQAWREALD
jgi:prophage regulatory protein